MVKIWGELMIVDNYKYQLELLGEAVEGEDAAKANSRKWYKDRPVGGGGEVDRNPEGVPH